MWFVHLASELGKEQNEEGVPALVFDDPGTAEPQDFWLHPCDCFMVAVAAPHYSCQMPGCAYEL